MHLRIQSAILGLALLILAACAAPAPSPDGARVETPAALTFTDPPGPGLDFPDYRAVAEASAGIYVRVRIVAEEERGGGPSNVLNFASGFIADGRGYVVTAAHIANATKFKAEVITLDGRRYHGRVVAVERGRELGLIKINPFPDMPVARFADSAELSAGEPALAIGTPAHHGGIVSVGRIIEPRLARRIHYNDYGYDNAIALAMAVEPGHSGGPLVDGRGRVIGMIASFLLGKGGSNAPHVALAVPSNDIAAFLKAHEGE